MPKKPPTKTEAAKLSDRDLDRLYKKQAAKRRWTRERKKRSDLQRWKNPAQAVEEIAATFETRPKQSVADELASLVGGLGTTKAPWEGRPTGATGIIETDERALDEEVIIGPLGKARQAGSAPAYGTDQPWLVQKRQLAEKSLYYFAKAIMGRDYLTHDLHRPVCDWLSKCPPRRKLLLMPREFAKSTLVAHALPIHIQIQPIEDNIYFPGERGLDQRTILMCENADMAKDRIRVIQSVLQENRLVRGLWPHVVWPLGREKTKKWNDLELILPRPNEYPDPSIRGVGVGGAITGAHPSSLIKDDLISFKAMNSPAAMQEAITYHATSRALISRPTCLEWIIGTRWAVYDLYSEIIEHDPTVEVLIRRYVEDGVAIYPTLPNGKEAYPLSRIPDLQKEHGIMWDLFYMNNAAAAGLVDFDMAHARWFEIGTDDGGAFLTYEEDGRDAWLADRAGAPMQPVDGTDMRMWGMPLTGETYNVMRSRVEHLDALRVYGDGDD